MTELNIEQERRAFVAAAEIEFRNDESCKGTNCGTTTGQHSDECYAEHDSCVHQGAIKMRQYVLEEVIETLEQLNDSLSNRASYDNDGMMCCEQTRNHTLCSAVVAIRALQPNPAKDGGEQ